MNVCSAFMLAGSGQRILTVHFFSMYGRYQKGMGIIMEKAIKKYFPIFALPTFAAFTIGFIIPFVLGVYLSFCEFTTVTDATFVGFKNYIRIWGDATFIHALWYTSLFTVVSVITINVLAFAVAMLLTKGIKGTNIFRTVFFMPNLIGGIILGYIWQLILNGILLHFERTLTYNSAYGFWGLVILMNWQQIGYMMIIYIAGIQTIIIVLMNSFKKKIFISNRPFSLPDAKSFVGLENYASGMQKIDFLHSFAYSLFITVGSVAVIILCTSMCAWYITRVKSKITSGMYYLFAFSMIVPFQMVMFTLSKIADILHLGNPVGIIIVYLGFGAGLAVFMFCGFVKSIPLEIEESAMIDGCNPLQTYFKIVFPVMKPTAISVAILEAMWVWNDYLLPYLVLDIKKYKTIPIAIQYLKGGYGAIDMGAMMAMIVLAIIPIIIFYIACQKHIIEGVVAGAVKG